MSAVFARALTLPRLRQLAGDTSFQRGQAYFAEGQVRSLVAHANTLTATVGGTQDYTVKLTAEKDSLNHRCSCPVGADGAFCKHGVAVALAWLAATSSGGAAAGPRDETTPLVTLDDVRPWLLQQSTDTLADLLLETAARDDRLREKLLRAAARASAKGVDVAGYRKSIDRVTRTGGFVDYGSASGFAEGVSEAIEPLREILADSPAHAAAVVDLAEHALARVEKALEAADDSDGDIGALLAELQELHLAACKVARPDPELLAARLYAWEVRGGWDVFYNAAETYAEIFGPTGLAVYRARAEAAWKALPALKPGASDEYGTRFRLTSIMEALARRSGDLTALVAVKSKNLSHAYRFLEIAQLYRDAGQRDAALDWAERGINAFPNDTDPRLIEFLAQEYHRRGRHEKALALIWRPFEERPSVEGYRLLKSHADRSLTWTTWRERALAHLRNKIVREAASRASRTRGHARWDGAHRATLVQIFLWEKDTESAWREAQNQQLPRDLWLELAAVREKEHPADAIPIYLREAETLIAQTGQRAYEAGLTQLRKIKALHTRLDRSAEWTVLIASLRATHKAKRNFIALVSGL